CVFVFNDTATTEIYTLSLHDALPIVHGRVEHGVSLQRRRGGLSQAEALRRPGSVVISVGHGACLSHAPRCNVASLQDETVAAVRLAPHVRTLPRRIRGA